MEKLKRKRVAAHANIKTNKQKLTGVFRAFHSNEEPLLKWHSQRDLIKKKCPCVSVEKKAFWFLVAAAHPCLSAHMELTAFLLSGRHIPLQMQISGKMHLLLCLKSISSPRH